MTIEFGWGPEDWRHMPARTLLAWHELAWKREVARVNERLSTERSANG